MKTQMFEEPFIECYLDDSVPVLAHFWKKHPNKDEFKAALLKMIDHFKSQKKLYHNLTWCGDTTNLGVLSLETQNWLNEKWSGIMVEAGVKYHALIVPKDVFAKHAMKKFKDSIDHTKDELIIAHFMDEPSAFEWLKERLK
jgi:hypothetical protein